MKKLLLLLVLLGLIALVTPLQSLRLKKTYVSPSHPFTKMGVRANAFATVSNQTISGNIVPVGIYWTQVQLGTPPQTFQLAVDTGSQDLIVPQAGCDGCHTQISGTYSPSASNTSTPLKCPTLGYSCSCANGGCFYKATYETCNLTAPQQPCSVYGQVYQDTVTLGGLSAKTAFGTIQNQTKNFQQFFYIDGVIGFVPDHDTSFGGVSVFQRLVDAGLVDNVFSICLNSHSGGVITLGGTDPSLYTGSFQYSPLVAGNGYQTPLENIGVGTSIGTPLDINIIIDSGTNVLLLPNKAYQNVKDQFTSSLCPNFTIPGVCGTTNLFTGECYTYTQAQIAQFPTVTLNLKGASLQLTGADYLINNSTTSTTYCLGITNTGIGGLPIIGDVVMQAYYTQFDLANNRLGWAPVNAANC